MTQMLFLLSSHWWLKKSGREIFPCSTSIFSVMDVLRNIKIVKISWIFVCMSKTLAWLRTGAFLPVVTGNRLMMESVRIWRDSPTFKFSFEVCDNLDIGHKVWHRVTNTTVTLQKFSTVRAVLHCLDLYSTNCFHHRRHNKANNSKSQPCQNP